MHTAGLEPEAYPRQYNLCHLSIKGLLSEVLCNTVIVERTGNCSNC